MSKKCKKCKVEKDLSEYHIRNRAKDGLDSKCKCCIKIHNASDKMRAALKKNREINRYKKAAQNAANYAIKRGILIRPENCEKCGVKARIIAHHEDYQKQLEVDFICNSCHRKRHHELKLMGIIL